MDLPVDNDGALRDNRNEDANAEAPIPSRLHSFGARLRSRGVRATFRSVETEDYASLAAVLVLYLLYQELRQEIVKELRAWIVPSRRFGTGKIRDMFNALGDENLAEEIEQEYGEAMLEFADVLGSLMVEARRKVQGKWIRPLLCTLQVVALPLGAPLGHIVAAKLLQYVQSVESVTSLTLSWHHRQHLAFRHDEVEQLVDSILNLKQLTKLDIQIDMTGVLLVELCANLKDLKNLSIRSLNWHVPQELPKATQLIRSIQQMSSLETLHMSGLTMGEMTVNLFSSSEGTYTHLRLNRCSFLIGEDDDGSDPSELPLAVALASNARLEELRFDCVHGSGAFFIGIEQGLLKNRTLRTLRVTNFAGPAHQRIPEFACFGYAVHSIASCTSPAGT